MLSPSAAHNHAAHKTTKPGRLAPRYDFRDVLLRADCDVRSDHFQPEAIDSILQGY